MKKKEEKKLDLRIDRDKVFCVSLKSHSDAELKLISDLYLVSYDSLLELKEEGCQKVWLHRGGDWLIAFTTKKHPDFINICTNYSKNATGDDRLFLRNIKQVPTPKSKKKNRDSDSCSIAASFDAPKSAKSAFKSTSKLDVDAILEKIFKFGIESMTKEEKAFMDAQSKK